MQHKFKTCKYVWQISAKINYANITTNLQYSQWHLKTKVVLCNLLICKLQSTPSLQFEINLFILPLSSLIVRQTMLGTHWFSWSVGGCWSSNAHFIFVFKILHLLTSPSFRCWIWHFHLLILEKVSGQAKLH